MIDALEPGTSGYGPGPALMIALHHICRIHRILNQPCGNVVTGWAISRKSASPKISVAEQRRFT
jgi:hypothetical protein